MEVRAIWDFLPTPTPTTSIPAITATACQEPFALPQFGKITFGDGLTIELDVDALFTPQCEVDASGVSRAADEDDPSSIANEEDDWDPFYASMLPAVYVLAATTVIAYILVIMLFITPRTFITGGTVVLGYKGGFSSSTASSSAGVGIGGRPWLQKIAALSVAISLTIATANSLNIAEAQYNDGYMNAKALQEEVLNGQELKIIMVISDTFLWLAQAQTLIRLFPRHREKVIIKWTALALITLCVLFSILNDFVYKGNMRPVAFVDAIPALSYLFQLALGILYAAWVIYYALTKKRYAFYHKKMRNMFLLAIISVSSVIIPVVFFVLDISKPNVAVWGDYVRWVGAAAASVIVWEWVERIEALERNEKKDGILGREIFDGDEMLDVTPSTADGEDRGRSRDNDTGKGGASWNGSNWPGYGRLRKQKQKEIEDNNTRRKPRQRVPVSEHTPPKPSEIPLPLPSWPTRPTTVLTPISRTDTGSAESTIYAVRYHPIGEASQTIPEHPRSRPISRGNADIEAQVGDVGPANAERQADVDGAFSSYGESKQSSLEIADPQPAPALSRPFARAWAIVDNYNPFSARRNRPPAEIRANANRRLSFHGREKPSTSSSDESGNWDFLFKLGKLEDLAAMSVHRMASRSVTRKEKEKAAAPVLPITRIPAPPRRRTVEEIQEEMKQEELERAKAQAMLAASRSAPMTPVSEGPHPLGSGAPRLLSRRNTADANLVVRGSLAFAEPAQRAWGDAEHDALGTESFTETAPQVRHVRPDTAPQTKTDPVLFTGYEPGEPSSSQLVPSGSLNPAVSAPSVTPQPTARSGPTPPSVSPSRPASSLRVTRIPAPPLRPPPEDTP
jgi:hypothetical protein